MDRRVSFFTLMAGTLLASATTVVLVWAGSSDPPDLGSALVVSNPAASVAPAPTPKATPKPKPKAKPSAKPSSPRVSRRDQGQPVNPPPPPRVSDDDDDDD
ncbi:hypothetical protein [Rhizohabitans arisaemae]|uniref:hypothetical protein n=1 Tax=Rhizohabitans arisaemae TaxID=2720610 RepID=UPI0024B04E1C|nr:hypothetical protein [Rhizohabitans arisaemae]